MTELPPFLDLRQRLMGHLEQLCRERDPFLATQGHFYVQQYIQTQWQDWGRTSSHPFLFRGRTFYNHLLDLPGRRSGPPVLVGAHYDAVPGTTGADDNASGVAVLLELARYFAQGPGPYPMRFVAFDLEEMGYAQCGSAQYARDLGKEPLRLMLSLEMLGYRDSTPGSQQYPLPGLDRLYPKAGDYLALVGNFKALPDLLRLSHFMGKQLPTWWIPSGFKGELLPTTRRSDHAAFWDRGDRAIMVTDTADLRNPHYHSKQDQIKSLDLDFLTQGCLGLISAIANL
jgi:Zn-dependent M28 family amino/carboxypeptidase